MSLVLFELGFKQFEQGESVRCASGKTGQYLIFVQASYFARVTFHHGVAHGDLPVTTDYHAVSSAYR
jgi:hypothetical protein